jgi:predicted DNA-binding transcriptional regulator AlpA
MRASDPAEAHEQLTPVHTVLLRYVGVSERTGFSPNTIRNWASNPARAPKGFPRPIRIGRIPMFRAAEIEAFIAAQDQRASSDR